MYVPAHFAAKDGDALVAKLARAHAGVLVTVGSEGEPLASHLPFLWDAAARTLTGHIARANPHWTQGGGKGLVIFSGADAYVSPGFYPSKAEHGKVVPTWNYEAVYLSGAVTWIEDGARLETIVRALSDRHETGRAKPWRIEDAPRAYIDALLRGIVGVEMRVEKIEAKQKLSQNKNAADFDGVMRGLGAQEGESREVAALMAGVRAGSSDPDSN
ncbi:MAG: FMN-binding negative transcriptional regulator [Hyphomonadaceae bacterium]|nr:FMN-binding negative transcriptional regulator [Hyphomonadaceae bacterium]